MKKISSILGVAAIAGVIGLGGLTLTGGAVHAITTGNSSSGSGSTSGSGGTTRRVSNTTTTPTTEDDDADDTLPETSAATTPDTGLFTADGEFASTEGAVVLMGILAAVMLGFVVVRNRKDIFRGRVNFNK